MKDFQGIPMKTDLFPVGHADGKKKKSDASERIANQQERPQKKESPPPAPVSAPRVTIVDGKIVFDQSSLVVVAHVSNSDNAHSTEVYQEELETAHTAMLQRRQYGRRQPTTGRWSNEDTHKFYQALQQCGTDFSMMQQLFTNRTRRELKSKYLREDRSRHHLVNLALKTSIPIEMEAFEQLLEEAAAGGVLSSLSHKAKAAASTIGGDTSATAKSSADFVARLNAETSGASSSSATGDGQANSSSATSDTAAPKFNSAALEEYTKMAKGGAVSTTSKTTVSNGLTSMEI